MGLYHAILKLKQNRSTWRRWQIYCTKMIQSHRFTVSQEETGFMYMPLLHQVMKWNTSCTMSLIHCLALSAAVAIWSYHALKILKDYGYKSQRFCLWWQRNFIYIKMELLFLHKKAPLLFIWIYTSFDITTTVEYSCYCNCPLLIIDKIIHNKVFYRKLVHFHRMPRLPFN